MEYKSVNELVGAVRTELSIAGRMFDLWFLEGDSYLNSREALNVRATEASAFRNTCIQLLRDLNAASTECLDIGAKVGLASLVLGQLSYEKKTSTPISRIISFEPEPLTFRCIEKNTQVFPGLITAVNCALGVRSETLSFLKTPSSTSASHVVTEGHFTGTANEMERLMTITINSNFSNSTLHLL